MREKINFILSPPSPHLRFFSCQDLTSPSSSLVGQGPHTVLIKAPVHRASETWALTQLTKIHCLGRTVKNQHSFALPEIPRDKLLSSIKTFVSSTPAQKLLENVSFYIFDGSENQDFSMQVILAEHSLDNSFSSNRKKRVTDLVS